MGMPFLLQTPHFLCARENGLYQPCSEEELCRRDAPFQVLDSNSIAKEFGLYCEKRYLLGVAGSLFFIGNRFLII